MTVVAWDGKTLAADKRTSFGGLHATTTKVHRLSDGRLVSGTGATAQLQEMRHWLQAGADPETFPAAQRDGKECVSLLVVQRDGSLIQYENTPYPMALENRQWAIGSGRDFAVMAMHLGKTAAEAVQLTALFCHDCGNGVDALELEAIASSAAAASPARAPAAIEAATP